LWVWTSSRFLFHSLRFSVLLICHFLCNKPHIIYSYPSPNNLKSTWTDIFKASKLRKQFYPKHTSACKTSTRVKPASLSPKLAKFARFHTSAAAQLRSSFFCGVTLRKLVVGYRRFGTSSQFPHQGSSIPKFHTRLLL
jgi:hypothetical protein